MMLTTEPDIILVGFMGAGKSAVGRKLAKILQRRLFDTDHEIELCAGMSVAEIFARQGEEYFRQLETKILDKLIKYPRGSLVISSGGGILTHPPNRQVLKSRGLVVWLTASPEAIYQRVESDGNVRPLLQADDPIQRIEELLAEREIDYRRLANLFIDTSDKDPYTIAKTIAATFNLLNFHAQGE